MNNYKIYRENSQALLVSLEKNLKCKLCCINRSNKKLKNIKKVMNYIVKKGLNVLLKKRGFPPSLQAVRIFFLFWLFLTLQKQKLCAASF